MPALSYLRAFGVFTSMCFGLAYVVVLAGAVIASPLVGCFMCLRYFGYLSHLGEGPRGISDKPSRIHRRRHRSSVFPKRYCKHYPSPSLR